MITVHKLENYEILLNGNNDCGLVLNLTEAEQLWQELMQICQEFRIKEKQGFAKSD